MKSHINVDCAMKKLCCDECFEKVLRKDMKCHLLHICREYKIKCMYASIGCTAIIRRSLMAGHMKTAETHHLNLKVECLQICININIVSNDRLPLWSVRCPKVRRMP